ncbi:MAG: hypothetical protein CVT49_04455 [candidate division Zixibacteria bacterium HGW-Zixibacteria-1]|nr:MAG: hypothetical protein CVT49_04455 [candidate division Zixibacteria bacterium HGW-Zixibacteria-1]
MMTLLVIIAALIILFCLVLAASIRIRAKFDDSEKTVAAAYIFLKSTYDISSKTVMVSAFGIRLFSFPIKSEKKKKEPAPEVEEKKKKKRKRFSFSDIDIKYLKMAKALIGGTKIKELAIKIRGGFTEPFYTGKMYGYYWAAKGMYPKLMSHVDFKPDFSSGTLIFEGKGLVTLRMYYIFRFVCSFLYDRLKHKLSK